MIVYLIFFHGLHMIPLLERFIVRKLLFGRRLTVQLPSLPAVLVALEVTLSTATPPYVGKVHRQARDEYDDID